MSDENSNSNGLAASKDTSLRGIANNAKRLFNKYIKDEPPTSSLVLSTELPLTHQSNGKSIEGSSGFFSRPNFDAKSYSDNKLVAYEFSDKSSLSDGSNGKHHKPPASYNSQSWDIGWTDGRLGQSKDPGRQVAANQAIISWLNKMDGDLLQLGMEEADLEGVKGIRERIQSQLNRVAQYLDKDEFIGKSASLSFLLGFLYLAAAGLLMGADLPLTVNLVKDGFRLGQFTQENLTGVTPHVWLLAVGIAFSGIFLKYFLDEVITSKNRKIFLWITFFFFIITVVVLGLFRADINYASATHQNIEGNILLNQATFIALTIMLPLIGGICFSAGWNEFRFFLAERKKSRLHVKLDLYSKEYNKLFFRIKAKREIIQREEEKFGTEKILVDLYQSIYEHGYARGENVPETLDENASLYKRCEKVLERLHARKSRDILGKA